MLSKTLLLIIVYLNDGTAVGGKVKHVLGGIVVVQRDG